MGYDHRWLEDQGLTVPRPRIVVLGTLLARSSNQGLRGAAGPVLFECWVPAVVEFHSPRACLRVVGTRNTFTPTPADRQRPAGSPGLGAKVAHMYESVRRPDWKWFEDVVAYGMRQLPQAMLLSDRRAR